MEQLQLPDLLVNSVETEKCRGGSECQKGEKGNGGGGGECRVCGAEGATRHYGSVCCSGCKGFFRRSVRNQKVYRCPNAGQCDINRLYRNCCRECRFRKCLRIGMDPNLVHGDWGQNGTTTVAFSLGQSSQSDALPKMAKFRANCELSSFPPAFGGPSAETTLVQHHQLVNVRDLSSVALGFSNRGRFGPIGNDCVALSNYFLAVEKLCDLYVELPKPPSCADPRGISALYSLEVPVEVALKQPGKVSVRTPIDWSGKHLIGNETLARSYCRVMVHYFDWVSYVPEMNEMTEEDKQTLTVKRAMRCVWLLCSFRSALLNIDGIAGCCERMFPYSPEQRERLDPELKRMFLDSATMAFTELVLPFRKLRLTESEYVILRALCLFSPVPRLTENGRETVERARDRYLNCLSELLRRSERGGGESALGRMSRLMTFLATVEQVAEMDDNAFAMLNVFNLAGMRGMLTYDMHIKTMD
ncbi:hypothetical protein niasHT_033218 [Heterodera trifolii]|uniref:Uncharacterized protein n=1 Tax=Heterodera trifolii TaxID=157864 RepID=A0ABD2IW20_9BILA